MFNNKTLPNNAHVEGQTRLIINNVDKKNVGLYECEGLIDEGTFFAMGQLILVGMLYLLQI